MSIITIIDTIIEAINKIVFVVNDSLNSISFGNGNIIVLIISVSLGWIMSVKFDDRGKFNTFTWIIFSILAFTFLRYLGFGGK